MKPSLQFQWTSLIAVAEKRLLAMTLAALLCWQVAGWGWYFFAPSARPVSAELRGEISLGAISRLAWFGVEPVLPVGGPAVATDLKIIGLYSGGARPVVLIAAGTQDATAYGEGDEVVAGIKLTKIEVDHVLIDRNGVTERINVLAPVAAMALEKPENQINSEQTQNKYHEDTPKK